jgi:hypothetical protein
MQEKRRKRREVINVRVTPEERERLKARAAAKGLSLSDLVRDVLCTAEPPEKPEAPASNAPAVRRAVAPARRAKRAKPRPIDGMILDVELTTNMWDGWTDRDRAELWARTTREDRAKLLEAFRSARVVVDKVIRHLEAIQ